MAEEPKSPEEVGTRPSSPYSQRIESPVSLPGGRSSAAERRVGARRRYTPEERARLLREHEASGLSVEPFCAQHGIQPSTLHTWRQKARRGARGKSRVRLHRIYSPEERRAAVEAWSKSGLSAPDFAKLWGVSSASLRNWRRSWEIGGAKALEPKRQGRPKGEGRSQLPEPLQSEILRTKRRFPSFGLKKVRDFLKRFGGQSVSTGSVRKVLKSEGLHQPPVKRRKKKHAVVRRFERSKPGELWQTDITSFVLTRSRVRVYLTVFLDDFSRYVVAWQLATRQKSQLVCEALMEGVERFGKPKEVLSDQGRQYYAWRGKSDFQRLLVREGIQHVVSRTHHPQTLGKCERLWATINTELWERTQPQALGEARERLAHYFAHYNHFRPHQGIDGLVPADRFFKAEEALRQTLEARMERDELSAALAETPRESVYVFGQVGDQQVSLHGERGRIVLVTNDGVSKELALEDLGLPQKEKSDDGCEDGDGDGDGDGREGTAHTQGQETAGLPAAASGAGLGETPVGGGGPGGEGAGAPDLRGDSGDVVGEEESGGGGERAGAAAAAGVAAEPGGAGGYAGGPAQTTPGPGQGADHDAHERGRPARAEETDQRAGGGEQGSQGALGSPEDSPVRGGSAPAVSPAQTGGEEAWQEERGTPRPRDKRWGGS